MQNYDKDIFVIQCLDNGGCFETAHYNYYKMHNFATPSHFANTLNANTDILVRPLTTKTSTQINISHCYKCSNSLENQRNRDIHSLICPGKGF